MTSSPQQQQQPPPPPIEDLDWEEWDSTTGLSFTHHCLAGSFAGVAEHTLLYPLDTVKTCWQSQVLHRAAAGGSGGGTHIAAAGCDPCSVHQTVNKLATSTSTATSSSIVSSASNNTTASAASQHHQQSIWSTMKHLMRHGSHHHHNHHHSAQFSHPHAHVTTLANGNTTSSSHLAPNVVDFTNNSTATNNTSSSGGRNKQQRRPWSKSARMVRGATLHDIAPSLQPSLYHTTGTATTTSASASGGGALSSSLSSTINSTNIQNVASSGINNSTNTNNTGFKRLWRGVQTMFVGCIPAHALYFSSYEGIKSMCLTHNTTTTKNNSHAHVNETSQQQQQHHHVGIDTLSPLQAMFAGGIATLLHDFIMTPMDTMKQRMQLGHYYNLRDAFCSIVWGDRQLVSGNGGSSNSSNTIKEGVRMGGEGWKGLYRSFPITVMTNVPYGMIMMTTNEWLRAVLEDGLYGFHEHNHHPGGGDEKPFHFATILLSGMGAGMVASAITAPLDRVKTRLQTQRMGMMIPSVVPEGGGVGSGGGGGGGSGAIMEERALAAAMGERKVCPKMAVQDVKSALFPSTSSSTSSVVASSSSSIGGGGSTSASFIPRSPSSVAQSPFTKTYYTTPIEAFQSIIQEEGPRGLFRGALPRVALHAPSVAISWTAYEMAKGWLLWAQ